MRHIQTLLLSFSFAALCFSCNDSDAVIEQSEILSESTTDLVKSITARVADFKFDEEPSTRLSHDYSPSTGYTFAWELGDTLGIFPVENNQVEFPVTEGIGTSSAVFNGGAWALRANYHYAAYYPYDVMNTLRKITALPADYSGQVMDGSNPLAHFSKYDFLVSAPQETNEQGSVNLNLEHLGCFTRFVLTLPEPGTYTYLALDCKDVPFIHEATYDLSAETPALTSKKSYTNYRIDLKNITTTTTNEEVVIYAMFAPVNQLGKTIELSVLNSEGKLFATTVPGKNMQAGHAYKYQPTEAFTEVVEVPMAKLMSGTDFNAAIKTLANRSTKNCSFSDQIIKSIKFITNSNVSTGTKVSTSNSKYPIYANYSAGEVTISTEAAELACNSDMKQMFRRCEALRSLDLTGINTQNVTDMSRMFEDCKDLTSLDLSGINTQNVTNMGYMFQKCISLASLDLSGFNTQNVTNMSWMFAYCEALTSLDLSGFNTQNVTDMSLMFNDCESLASLDLTDFNTQNVTSMCEMFLNCKSMMTLKLSSFNTQNVTDMYQMFYMCQKLQGLDVSNFNTQKVTNMGKMFSYCKALPSLDVSNFDTKNVTDMTWMFRNCEALTSLDLSSFNTQNVLDMKYMFEECAEITSLNFGLGFVIGSSTNKSEMFYNFANRSKSCTISCTEATQKAINTGTYLTTSYITWNILQ